MAKKKEQQPSSLPPVALLILDGFGLADVDNTGNAITPETAPHIFSYMETYPATQLIASGPDVGLFPGQSGNSEAGHFNIGAGRVVEQDLFRISEAIDDGTFFKNTAFEQALFHAKKYKSKIHVMGLLTDKNSPHARDDHLYALLKYFRQKGQKNVFLHLFTDGRDASPHGAIHFLHELREHMTNGEQVATVMGRLYGMDRNKNWERTEEAYNAIVLGEASHRAHSPEEAITQAYNRDESDEFIPPTVIADPDGTPRATIEDTDIIFFFNARSDRARQLTKALVQPQFVRKNPGAFHRKRVPDNTRFVAMADFGPDLPGVLTAFPSPDVENCLAAAIGENRSQLFISETEKYAHVTFFLNGGYPEPINGESRFVIRSKNVKNFAVAPRMEVDQLRESIISVLDEHMYDFICANFPNADMVGHTGNIAAAKIAVAAVDDAVHEVVNAVLERDGIVLITADHGNAEQMINEETGEVNTEHTTNPVPFIVVGKNLPCKELKPGRLADVAPTLLKLLNIPKPAVMTGEELY